MCASSNYIQVGATLVDITTAAAASVAQKSAPKAETKAPAASSETTITPFLLADIGEGIFLGAHGHPVGNFEDVVDDRLDGLEEDEIDLVCRLWDVGRLVPAAVLRADAGLVEGLPSLFLPHSRLYVE